VIRYALNCDREHRFDAWFRSSADCERQAEGGHLTCPACGSRKVAKALMAPALGGSSASGDDAPTSELALLGERETELRAMLRTVREEIVRNAEDVGPRFAEVARQMHDGEIEKSSVYGRASSDEVRALAEDGIEFHTLPVLPDDAN